MNNLTLVPKVKNRRYSAVCTARLKEMDLKLQWITIFKQLRFKVLARGLELATF